MSSSALEALRFHSHELIAPLRPGGLIGVELARLLNEILGFTGSTLLLLPVLAVGFSLLTALREVARDASPAALKRLESADGWPRSHW